MSAELLREAADQLDRLTEKTTSGTWKLWGMSVMADQDGTSEYDSAVDVAHTVYRDVNDKPRTWDAQYICLMQPEVGKAVAAWLRQESILLAANDRPYVPARALAVARAILRRES